MFLNNWSNETGQWSYETGHWSNETGHWSYETGQGVNETGHWSYETGQGVNETGHWSYETGHWSRSKIEFFKYWSPNPQTGHQTRWSWPDWSQKSQDPSYLTTKKGS